MSHNANFVGDALNAMEDDSIFAGSDSDGDKNEHDKVPNSAVANALQSINTADDFAMPGSTAHPANEEKQLDAWTDPEVPDTAVVNVLQSINTADDNAMPDSTAQQANKEKQ